MDNLTANNLVVKSNDLVEASYSLTLNEQRILIACISQIDSRETVNFDFSKGIKLTVEQIQDLFYSDGDKKNAYRDLKNTVETLYRRELRLYTQDKKQELLTRWVSEAVFNNEEQTATLYFYGRIQPFLTRLGSEFTEYRLKNIVQLTSIYAIRIYELIVRWSFNSSFKEMEIADFKTLLDLGNKYKQQGQFNDRVIKPALKQINEFTDFQLEIDFKKRGRSFNWIQLRFNKKPIRNAIENEELMHLELETLNYWETFRTGWAHICNKYGVDLDYLLHCLKKRETPEHKGQRHYDNLTHRYLAAITAKVSGNVQSAEHIAEEIKNLCL